MDLFKLIVLIVLIVALAVLLLRAGQTIPAAPQVSATATAPVVAQVTPTQPMPTVTQPMPTATQPVVPRLTSPVAGANLSDSEVTLKGTGQPGSTVQVLVNGTVVGEAVVGADGTWTLAVDLGKPGSYTLSAQVLDASGKPVAASDPLAVVLAAPIPAIVAPVLISPSAGDQLTVGQVTFKGTGAPGSEVEIVLDGKAIGKAKVDSDGTWSFTTELGQPGTHLVQARALDATGKIVAESALVSLSVAAAVVKPAITSPTAGASLPSGPMTLVGTGKAGDELEIVDGGKIVSTVKVGADSQWRFTYTPSSGERELLARVKANPDVASNVLKVTVAAPALLPPTGGACVGPEGRIKGHTYIVGACDTLFGISQITRVSLNALLAANPQIKDASLIYPGQVIQLPR
jgi:large repetitive protein